MLIAGEVFGTAPRELMRAVRLQQTVEIVRVVIDVVEAQVNKLAAPGGETQLREAILRYTREVAFGAAQVYARAAETRGAWDARLEALIVDALLRGEVDESLHSWAAALGWASTSVAVMAGHTPDDEPEAIIDDIRIASRRARVDVLAGVQGSRLIIIVGGVEDDPLAAAKPFTSKFGAGPVVVGPRVEDLYAATGSARAALAGLQAVAGWPDAPRPVLASALLAERALDGDDDARAFLVEEVYEPLRDGRRPAAGHADDLSGAGLVAGGHRAAPVRPPQHRPLPAQTRHGADRIRARRRPRRLHAAHRARARPLHVASGQLVGPSQGGPPQLRTSPHEHGASPRGTVGCVLAITAPGQGAQTPGFLEAWLELPGVTERLTWWSAVTGLDLIRYGTTADADEIRDTAVAQPLLVSAALIAYEVLDVRPGLVAGHSVGELAAAAVGRRHLPRGGARSRA